MNLVSIAENRKHNCYCPYRWDTQLIIIKICDLNSKNRVIPVILIFESSNTTNFYGKCTYIILLPGCETKQYGAHFPFLTIFFLLSYQCKREKSWLAYKTDTYMYIATQIHVLCPNMYSFGFWNTQPSGMVVDIVSYSWARHKNHPRQSSLIQNKKKTKFYKV